MSVSWTKEQQSVIDVRDKNVLVSAAAGSGKTAVLVERIIKRVTDSENPLDVDHLLVVTFTKAAAYEMKERIRTAIEKALKKDPQNAHLLRQETLLHHAFIMTIDSFCLSVLRNHFHRIDLEPSFRIGDENELTLLKSDILEELMEDYYGKSGEEFERFKRLVFRYASKNKDEEIRDMIHQLFLYSQSFPWPVEWLKSLGKNYEGSFEDWMQTPWMKGIFSDVIAEISDYVRLDEELIAICEEDDGPFEYKAALDIDLAGFKSIVALGEKGTKREEPQENEQKKSMTDAGTYADLCDAISKIQFVTLSRKKQPDADEEKKEYVKAVRNKIKDDFDKLKINLFGYNKKTKQCATKEQYEHAAALAKEAVDLLREMTLDFSERYAKKKREKNVIDFMDMEHFALQILVDEKTKEPTEIAKEYRDYFEEIMIDEYQDSNYVQETILTAIARKEPLTPNMFMVGDVKQSIYRFRLARPELFMEKFHDFKNVKGPHIRIDLDKNFRSRNEVIESVNEIFYRIMKKDLGGVEYDKEVALHAGASYPAGTEDEFCMETHVILTKEESKESYENEAFSESFEEGEGDNSIADLKNSEKEALFLASKIKKLMESTQVTDKETGNLRPLCYRDIVILMRGVSGVADDMVKIFSDAGIPACLVSESGYFSTTEVRTILAYLSLIDHSRQDIPLASVLHSPIGNFSLEELTKIRLIEKESSFVNCVKKYAEEGPDEALREKLRVFLEQTEKFRKHVADTPIHELLQLIYQETGYLDYVTALPDGTRRKANLQRLVNLAVSYGKTSYYGLFHFIRYIERLKQKKIDYGEADVVGENENAVQIMTIHKSKGLEFPVVIVAGMGKKFNNSDSRAKLLIHPEYGIALDGRDENRRTKHPTLQRKALVQFAKAENLGEELRVLYVALTRAKEKLILTGTLGCKNEEVYEKKYAGKDELSYTDRLHASCYFDWVLPVINSENTSCKKAITHNQFDESQKEQIEEDTRAEKEAEKENVLSVVMSHLEKNADGERQKTKELARRMEYQYPFSAEVDVKSKISVSELKHAAMRQIQEEPETVQWFAPKEKTVPSFLKKKQTQNIGAERGSAMHRFLECFDFGTLDDFLGLETGKQAAWVSNCADEMVQKGQITEKMREQLSIAALDHFLSTPLANRMKKAAMRGTLYKEKPFVMGLNAGEIYGTDSTEIVLIQGIIDVFFEEDDKICLLDYKTDAVKSEEELKNRYQKQLELYAKALARVSEKEILSPLIYSFSLGREIIL